MFLTERVSGILETQMCLHLGICPILHSSAKPQSPPFSVLFVCSRDKVYHKQEILFLLHVPVVRYYMYVRLLHDKHNPYPSD